MLRVQFHDKGDVVKMRIEGRFVGRFAEDLRDLISRRKIPSAFIVDISEVSFVDDTGEEVLTWLGRLGAAFLADSAYSRDVCERLYLRVVVEVHPHRYAPKRSSLSPAENPQPN